MDSRGSRVAFAAVSSENARFKTVVYTMNVDDTEPRAQFEYTGSSVLELRFSSTDLFVVGNDFVSVIDSLKTENRYMSRAQSALFHTRLRQTAALFMFILHIQAPQIIIYQL